jgi:hypothetical protein
MRVRVSVATVALCCVSIVSLVDVAGTCDGTHIYFGSNQKLHLRFRTGSTYCTSFAVDSMYVGNGYVLQPGDITIVRSGSATL